MCSSLVNHMQRVTCVFLQYRLCQDYVLACRQGQEVGADRRSYFCSALQKRQGWHCGWLSGFVGRMHVRRMAGSPAQGGASAPALRYEQRLRFVQAAPFGHAILDLMCPWESGSWYSYHNSGRTGLVQTLVTKDELPRPLLVLLARMLDQKHLWLSAWASCGCHSFIRDCGAIFSSDCQGWVIPLFIFAVS